MRKRVAIRIAMCVAVVGLLVAMALPHHHHAGATAEAVVHCIADDGSTSDDNHSTHGQADVPCIAKTAFNVAKQQAAPSAPIVFIAAPAKTDPAAPSTQQSVPHRAVACSDNVHGQSSPISTPRRGPPVLMA